ncbi:hypothetical protein Tco_1431941, partial [Tanacetum coccineum]
MIPMWTMKATYKVGGIETRWRDKNDIATKEVTLLTIWSIREKFKKIVQDGQDSLDDINRIDAVLNGLLEEKSRRKKTSVELNTNMDDGISSTQQENISQQRLSKKKRNMPQHLLVSDLVISVKTKGRPKRAIRVKPGLEVSMDLKKKNSLMRKKRAIERGEAENMLKQAFPNTLYGFSDDCCNNFVMEIISGCILFEFGSVYHLWVSVEFGAMGQLLVRKYIGPDNKKIPYLLAWTIKNKISPRIGKMVQELK